MAASDNVFNTKNQEQEQFNKKTFSKKIQWMYTFFCLSIIPRISSFKKSRLDAD